MRQRLPVLAMSAGTTSGPVIESGLVYRIEVISVTALDSICC